MKAKEYLHSKGLIEKIGKGRISHANHAVLQDAYDNGQRFSDWGPQKVSVQVHETVNAEGETVEIVKGHRVDEYASNGEIQDIAPYRFNHDTHAAYEDKPDGSKGKRRSLREVCTNDGVSLVQCTCGAPEIVSLDGTGHVAVTIYAEASKPVQGNVWDLRK